MELTTNIKSLFLLVILSGLFLPVVAQEKELVMVRWNENPSLQLTSDKYKDESAIIIFDNRVIEYIDNKEGLDQYRTVHKVIHINDDKGIEWFNKIYLEVNDNSDIRDIRARTILPGGRIIEVDKKNIRDIEQKERWYKIFAMEGVEKGCEVEFYYTYKVSPSYFGRETLQGPFPVIKSSVQIIAPERLLFDVKAYNCSETTNDTIHSGKRFIVFAQSDIVATEDEKYSAYDAMLKRVEYKLSYNNSRNRDVRLFTWNELAKLIYTSYTTATDGETKRTAEFVKRSGWDKVQDEADKVVQVENYLKTNVASRRDISGENAENIEKIIKNRVASNKGLIRLYSAIFTKLGIKHEFVIAGSRDSYEIDKTFENWDNAENTMIYFPGLQKYICPTLVEMRFPLISPLWGATNALFCKPTVIGNYTTALGVIKTVPLEDYTQTQNNINASIRFNTSLDTLMIDVENSYTGYSSVYVRSNYNFSSKEEQDAMLKDMVKSGIQSENIISSAFKNVEFDNVKSNQPFILDAQVKSVELMERAGKKILVKIGEVIGAQVEIYENRTRQLPVHINYPHMMKRTITLEIPEGYSVLNLNDLNIKSVFEDNGERTMGFESSYRVDKNTVIVDIIEDYRRVSYPISQYAPFQKIINAAADFNKVVLVLENK